MSRLHGRAIVFIALLQSQGVQVAQGFDGSVADGHEWSDLQTVQALLQSQGVHSLNVSSTNLHGIVADGQRQGASLSNDKNCGMLKISTTFYFFLRGHSANDNVLFFRQTAGTSSWRQLFASFQGNWCAQVLNADDNRHQTLNDRYRITVNGQVIYEKNGHTAKAEGVHASCTVTGAPATPRRRRTPVGPPLTPSPPPPSPRPTPGGGMPTDKGDVHWTKGGQGQNCMQACGGEEQCEETAWPASEQDFRRIMDKVQNSCSSVGEGDWLQNPAEYVDYDNVCYWKSGETQYDRCDRSHFAVARFCPCKKAVTTTTLPPTTQSPPSTKPPEGDVPPTLRRRRGGSRRRRRRRRRSDKQMQGDTRPSRRRRRGSRRRRKTA